LQESLVEPHPLVERTHKGLKLHGPERTDLFARGRRDVFQFRFRLTWSNALRIFDALLKAFKERGHKVSVSNETGRLTQVLILGEVVAIELHEHLERKERPAPPPGPRHEFSFGKKFAGRV
jgi:hypothetical protein